jgi:hypothetical protein
MLDGEEKDAINKRRRENARNKREQEKARLEGSALDADINGVKKYSLGEMDVICHHCGAKGYKDENRGLVSKPCFGNLCCQNGTVDVPLGRDFKLDGYVSELLTSNSPEAIFFRMHPRLFNSAMAMASVVTEKGNHWGRNNKGYTAVRISGQLIRRIGPMMPTHGVKPKFMQTYFFEPSEATSHRLNNFDLNPKDKKKAEVILTKLHDALVDAGNAYINDCYGVKAYIEKYHPEGVEDLTIRIHVSDKPDNTHSRRCKRDRAGIHSGRLNKPSVNEVSILFPNDATADHTREVVFNLKQPKDGTGVRRIRDDHRSYDPLSYPLLFNR